MELARNEDIRGGWRGPLLSAEDAGALLMISGERVRQLANDGWIARTGKQFHLVDAVQGFLRFHTDERRRASKSAADNRVRDARAREIELRNAVREGRLIEIEDALATVEALIGMFRAEIAGLPARVTRDLQFRRTIETATNDILKRIADAAAERERALAADSAVGATVGPDDAAGMGGGQSDLSANGSYSGSA